MHPDGYIQLKDRSKDIIISGGENISSIEVEDALFKHPKISAAAVVAAPDVKWGETPCAFIELHDGMEATAEEIIAWTRSQLASFKCPRHVIFVKRTRARIMAQWLSHSRAIRFSEGIVTNKNRQQINSADGC